MEITHDHLGGDVAIYGIGVLEIAGPCGLNVVDNKGAKAAFGGLVQLEIFPQRFVDGLRSEGDNGSGVVWDCQIYSGLCGRGEHLIMLQFVSSVGG